MSGMVLSSLAQRAAVVTFGTRTQTRVLFSNLRTARAAKSAALLMTVAPS